MAMPPTASTALPFPTAGPRSSPTMLLTATLATSLMSSTRVRRSTPSTTPLPGLSETRVGHPVLHQEREAVVQDRHSLKLEGGGKVGGCQAVEEQKAAKEAEIAAG